MRTEQKVAVNPAHVLGEIDLSGPDKEAAVAAALKEAREL
jgi:hypothetical protein